MTDTPLRRFIDIGNRQVHYRYCGDGPAIVIVHASPGSSRQMEGLMLDLANRGYSVFAPDTPGNGDSPKLPEAKPSVQDYAEALLLLLAKLGLKQPHIYGSHTGAAIAAELAIATPESVGHIVLEGIGVFSREQRDAFMQHYAPPFKPDLDGAYLTQAFHFCRDQYLFFPWYDRVAKSSRSAGLPSAYDLHAWVLEVLKANETYPLAYHAAFAWPALKRMPLVEKETLMLASKDDPLLAGTVQAAEVVMSGHMKVLPSYTDPTFSDQRASLIDSFLDTPVTRTDTVS